MAVMGSRSCYFFLHENHLEWLLQDRFFCEGLILAVSRQLPRRTIPHRTGFGPDEWFYSVVVVLVGSCPGAE